MAEFPALPLFTDAFLGDTTHLDAEETGAYLMLLMVSWRTKDCTLPDDDTRLARWARCTRSKWTRIRPVLEEFFEISDAKWSQKRLRDEREYVERKRDAAVANGRASALKRKGRHSTKRINSLNGSDEQTGERTANESSTPTPTPHLEEIDKSISPQLAPDQVGEAFAAYEAMRASIVTGARPLQLTDARRKKLALRLAELGGMEGWAHALGLVSASPFLRGESARGGSMVATIDWLIEPANLRKVMEGNYDGRSTSGAGTRISAADSLREARALLGTGG